jgi:hypothetical protein
MADDETPSGGAGKHLKRYGVFYAIAAAVVIALVVLPNVGGGDDDDDDAVATGDTTETTAAAVDEGGAFSPATGDIEGGTGETRDGRACTPDTPQVPDLSYSPPCLPVFDGDNGGETSKGVTADTIKVVIRSFPDSPNSLEGQRRLEEAGFATQEVTEDIRDQFNAYFNETYELYGRQVEFIEYESRFGDATAEAIGGGREGACQDATYIAEEIGAFAVRSGGGAFSECAAERGLVVFAGGPYFSEGFFEKWSPYVYNTTMSCDRVSAHVAEYVEKRLAGKPAEFAGDDLQAQERSFGTYVPDNEEYVGCADVTKSQLEEAGIDPGLRVTYQLDISKMADQATRAIVQFKAEGVTTVITAADPFSVGFLTNAAKEQSYFPEWMIIGTAATDSDNFGRQYNQEVVGGHMFGISQLASTRFLLGADSEPGQLYETVIGGEIPPGTTGSMYDYMHVFNLLMAAGPNLTPETLEQGMVRLPELGGPDFASGRWYFNNSITGGPDHTAVDDAREVYWDPNAEPGPEEPDRTKRGAFVESNPGVRYDIGEWEEGDPKVSGA